MSSTVGTVEFFTDTAGRTRWRRRDKDGEVLATSRWGYDTEAEAEEAMLQTLRDLTGTRVVSLGDTPPPGDAPPPPPGDIPPSYDPSAPQAAPEPVGDVDPPSEAPDPAEDTPGP